MTEPTYEIPEGVRIFKRSVTERETKNRDRAIREAHQFMQDNPKPIHQRLKVGKSAIKGLLDYIADMNEIVRGLQVEIDQLKGAESDRARKRWTEEEDQLLIDLATRDGLSMTGIATALGRTPGAVQARITHLVGIRRISEHFAGQISGYLNGTEIEGSFTGEIRRVN